MHTRRVAFTLILLTGLASCAETARADDPFAPSTAQATEVSAESLKKLDALVKGFVRDEEVVGAELLVLVNGRSVHHEAYGWKDREAELPMETGSVFCVRSMTKPVIGAAILMLIQDGRLSPDDRVCQYLPEFDVDETRAITIGQLLTHTSGLPMSLIAGRPLNELSDIRAVARLGAGYELLFAPGTAAAYSDQGTDTLTAVVEVVSGMPAAAFVKTRILNPLGMENSACVMTSDSPLRTRGVSKYMGSRGAWTNFWTPKKPPLFPIFLGSQGLYSTTRDYARFMSLWLRGGQAGTARLLNEELVRRTLTPNPKRFRSATGFPDLRADYGQLMQLWTAAPNDSDPDVRTVVAFGHSGSDGTHAWVFPKQNAQVLYFTQSRGNTTGLRVEAALGELFLGVPFDTSPGSAPPREQYVGYYWEGEGDKYRAIVLDGDDLALEVIGKAVVPLDYAGGDRWKLRPNPSVVLAFDRGETGEVIGYHIGDHQELRFEPSADLPTAGDLASRIAAMHHFELLETVGPIRLTSELKMSKLGLTGQSTTTLAWPGRYREDSTLGPQSEQIAVDGDQVRYASTLKGAAPVAGERAIDIRRTTPAVRFGDWRGSYPALQTIQRIRQGTKRLLLVRTGDTSAPAVTFYVDEESGRLLAEERVTQIEGLGRIGQRTMFGDLREVNGVLIPFATEIEVAHPLIGSVISRVTEASAGEPVPEGFFELKD